VKLPALALALSFLISLAYAPAAGARDTKWLIMVYMDGDKYAPDTCYFSLEEPGITDLNEMEMGINDNVTVIVQFDRGSCDHSNDAWDTTRRYRVTPDRTEEHNDCKRIDSELIEDVGEKNMGDPETLIDFATWACERFPAGRRALILWNHGSGWMDSYPQENETPVKGICIDNYDELTIDELDRAMSTITSSYDIDLLGFDACLMQMIEVDYALKEYVPVIVGSEEVEPGGGWSYDMILREAASASTPEDLARAIVDTYITTSTLTLSAIDTSGMDGVVEALNGLCDRIVDEDIDVSGPVNNAYYLEHFDAKDNKDYADLYSFAESLQLPEAAELMEAIERCVICEAHGNKAETHGISVWMPRERSDALESYRSLGFSETKWDELIDHYLPPQV